MKYRSTTHYILSALVPYTEANIKLAFRPGLFFKDLEKLSGYTKNATTLSTSYYRSVRQGMIEVGKDGSPRLTEAGLARLKRYEPRKLKGSASVLVIFDIPEGQRHLRRRLRVVLRELRFTPLQQSVWQSEYDVLDYLVPEIKNEGLEQYVQVHESARIV